MTIPRSTSFHIYDLIFARKPIFFPFSFQSPYSFYTTFTGKRTTDPKRQVQEICSYIERARREWEKWRWWRRRRRRWMVIEEKNAGEPEAEQRDRMKHEGKQSRRQLSVSRAKIAGQFPPLRACTNLFLSRFLLSPSPQSLLATDFTGSLGPSAFPSAFKSTERARATADTQRLT